MRWIRENRVDAAACAAIALGLALLAWVLIPRVMPDTGPAPAVAADPSIVGPYSSEEDRPDSDDPDGSAEASGATVPAQVEQGLATFGASNTMDGLAGGGGVANLPRHTVTVSMSSEAPVGTVGYIFPTSLRDSSGVRKNVGTSFSVTTTVYGDPDYAQGFAQAGQRGFPITCTITVDGRVTERQSTEGPYGALFCQG